MGLSAMLTMAANCDPPYSSQRPFRPPKKLLYAGSSCQRPRANRRPAGAVSRVRAVATEAEDMVTMDKIVALCKRRGFVFQSSEIYGGLASTYDYGHYGVLLKTNVKNEWWRSMIQERDDIVAIDTAILMHPMIWEASGHLEGFTDPLVQCLGECKRRWREDHLREAQPEGELHCPECGGELSEPRQFNLMFKTFMGPVEEDSAVVYLRPETAQGIFVNFKNVLQFSRKRPPFGIAQVGKSFRNEITPGNFVFRTREFEQMEMEFFVPPAEAERWHGYWLEARNQWYTDLGLRPDHLRLRAHDADELSHYSSATSDIEYLFPIGWSELEGIANRGDFDLTQHAQHSGEKLEYVDSATGDRYVPHVIEPAAGADRAMLAFMVDAYDEEVVEGRERVLLRLHPRLAPVKVAVLPLVNKDGQPEIARRIYEDLRSRMSAEYDAGGSIGKRYRRQDEIGTPWGVTVDHQTLEDDTVTLRDRDSLDQSRIAIAELRPELERRLAEPWRSPKLGD
jgi:glycyl-tRNA synthetase